MKTNNEIYKTKDLVVASYLAYRRIKMTDSWDAQTRTWSFDNVDGICERLELDVRNGEAKVAILDYETARKNVLSMVK